MNLSIFSLTPKTQESTGKDDSSELSHTAAPSEQADSTIARSKDFLCTQGEIPSPKTDPAPLHHTVDHNMESYSEPLGKLVPLAQTSSDPS